MRSSFNRILSFINKATHLNLEEFQVLYCHVCLDNPIYTVLIPKILNHITLLYFHRKEHMNECCWLAHSFHTCSKLTQ